MKIDRRGLLAGGLGLALARVFGFKLPAAPLPELVLPASTKTALATAAFKGGAWKMTTVLKGFELTDSQASILRGDVQIIEPEPLTWTLDDSGHLLGPE